MLVPVGIDKMLNIKLFCSLCCTSGCRWADMFFLVLQGPPGKDGVPGLPGAVGAKVCLFRGLVYSHPSLEAHILLYYKNHFCDLLDVHSFRTYTENPLSAQRIAFPHFMSLGGPRFTWTTWTKGKWLLHTNGVAYISEFKNKMNKKFQIPKSSRCLIPSIIAGWMWFCRWAWISWATWSCWSTRKKGPGRSTRTTWSSWTTGSQILLWGKPLPQNDFIHVPSGIKYMDVKEMFLI